MSQQKPIKTITLMGSHVIVPLEQGEALGAVRLVSKVDPSIDPWGVVVCMYGSRPLSACNPAFDLQFFQTVGQNKGVFLMPFMAYFDLVLSANRELTYEIDIHQCPAPMNYDSALLLASETQTLKYSASGLYDLYLNHRIVNMRVLFTGLQSSVAPTVTNVTLCLKTGDCHSEFNLINETESVWTYAWSTDSFMPNLSGADILQLKVQCADSGIGGCSYDSILIQTQHINLMSFAAHNPCTYWSS